MLRRPPSPTLFPTRRSSDLHFGEDERKFRRLPVGGRPLTVALPAGEIQMVVANTLLDAVQIVDRKSGKRSEEHTSELQSRFDLVCRLLLEKKKRSRAISSKS